MLSFNAQNNYLMSNLPIFFLFFVFWTASSATAARILKLPLTHPLSWSVGFAIYWCLNILVTYTTFLLPFRFKETFIWFSVGGLTAIQLLFYVSIQRIRLQRNVCLILAIVGAIGMVGLWPVPVSDTDSISYVLPMVDTAHSQHNFGIGESFNFRSNGRFWGVQAQLFNYTSLTKSYEGALSLNSMSYLFFAVTLYGVARKLTNPFRASLISAVLVFNPFFLTAVFTLKDDIAFAGFLILGGLLVPRKLSSGQTLFLFALLGMCLATSKVFYPLAFLTLVLASILYQPKKWKQYGSIAFSLTTGLICIWVLHSDRISNYQNTLESLTERRIPFKAQLGGLLGAAINELGVDLQSKSATTNVNGGKFESKETAGVVSTFLLETNQKVLYRALTTRNPDNHVYYYNYTVPNILLYLGILAVLPITVATYSLTQKGGALTRRHKIYLWLTCFSAIYTASFLLVYTPTPSNLRYLFAPIGLIVLLSLDYLLSLLPKKPSALITGLIALTTGFLSYGLVTHPAFTESWQFLNTNNRSPSAIEVTSFNPILETLKIKSGLTAPKGKEIKELCLQTQAVISAPLYPGFSSYSLFTYPAMPVTFEILAIPENLRAVLFPINSASMLSQKGAPIVIMSGAWNVGKGNLIPESSKEAVFLESYKLKYNLGPNEIHILTK